MPYLRSSLIFIAMTTALMAQISNVDFPTQVNPIFTAAGCTASSCHGGSAGGLSLGSDAATNYDTLVGVASSCNLLNYITANDTTNSHLFLKIKGNQACGNRMPANNPNYFDSNADKLHLIRVWITEGALAEVITNAVVESSIAQPTQFVLAQNHPNPFNPNTTIDFSLPYASDVDLVVYDMIGREVTVLVRGYRPAGQYRITWNGRNSSGKSASSGVYYYRLSIGGTTEMRKMVLLR